MLGGSFWAVSPTRRRAALWTLSSAGLAFVLAWGAVRLSPFSARSHLPLAASEQDALYLTPLPEDPARALLARRRENSTWARDQGPASGDPYWVRRYADPARPGLPDRILLTSRTRGAHLLVPLGALDLERALAQPNEIEPGAETGAGGPPGERLRRSLTRLYWRRSFAGFYLHLRFPKRVTSPEADEELDHDLLIVRENELVTTDFLLQPNGELYGAALADGLMPRGPLRVNPLTGELVLLMSGDPDRPGTSLYAPVPLLEELRLCWGSQLGSVLDDRWRLDSAAPYELRAPSAAVRARTAWNGALHLAARLESPDERRALHEALTRFEDS